jgi:DNA-binding MarR family transcriptional regulator
LTCRLDEKEHTMTTKRVCERVTDRKLGYITPRQATVLDALRWLTSKTGRPPATRELIAETGKSQNAVIEALARLTREGCVVRLRGAFRFVRYVATNTLVEVREWDNRARKPARSNKPPRQPKERAPREPKVPRAPRARKARKPPPAQRPLRVTWCAWCGADADGHKWGATIIRSESVRFCKPECLAEYDLSEELEQRHG